jgi:hypothetical protein
VCGRPGSDIDLLERRSLGAPNRIPRTSVCIGVAAALPRMSGEIYRRVSDPLVLETIFR